MLYRRSFQHLYQIERKRIPPTPESHMRLHRLERPEPWEQELRARMWDMPANASNHYPDYVPFYSRLSEFAGVPKEKIVVGAGIEDFIRTLAFLACDPGDGMAYTWPTCAMFDIYADVVGARKVRIETDPDRPLTAADVVAMIDDGVRLVILPNPGQPLDLCFSPDDLRPIANRCADIGAVLAVDEAYFHFGASTALPLLDTFDNVLVLRTFSKAFGGAALRVGYAMGNRLALKPLEAARTSGEISGPSLHAATVLMDNWDEYVAYGIHQVAAGRDWLRNRLQSEGFRARGEFANHVLIDMGTAGEAAFVHSCLDVRGIHIRRNAAPLDRFLMVTCGSVPLIEAFFQAFRDVARFPKYAKAA